MYYQLTNYVTWRWRISIFISIELIDFLTKTYLHNQNSNAALLKYKKKYFFILLQAQTHLGVYYTEEETQDLEKAVSFFKAAAEQNVRFHINQNKHKY